MEKNQGDSRGWRKYHDPLEQKILQGGGYNWTPSPPRGVWISSVSKSFIVQGLIQKGNLGSIVINY